MHMPVMDGLEASSRIIELKAGIPIVAMTANIMSTDKEVYRMSGIHDCVGKPFTSQELWRCLMKYFEPVNWQNADGKQDTQIDDELWLKLASGFVKDNRNLFIEVEKALNTGDIQLAHRLAHTLKSSAAYLGKTRLQQIAADIEHQLKEGKNLVTPQQMATFKTELNTALAELEAKLPPVSGAAPPKVAVQAEPINAESARELIKNLEPMLEMGNLECREHIDSLRRIPGTEELIRQMEDLDLKEALVTLADLKKNLAIP